MEYRKRSYKYGVLDPQRRHKGKHLSALQMVLRSSTLTAQKSSKYLLWQLSVLGAVSKIYKVEKSAGTAEAMLPSQCGRTRLQRYDMHVLSGYGTGERWRRGQK